MSGNTIELTLSLVITIANLIPSVLAWLNARRAANHAANIAELMDAGK